MTPDSPRIILIGNDAALTYLIGRYAERSGYELTLRSSVLSAEEVCDPRPAAVLFASLEQLEASQTLIGDLTNCEIPVLVCSTVAEETRAREMGADHCLIPPLTYDCFTAALQLQ